MYKIQEIQVALYLLVMDSVAYGKATVMSENEPYHLPPGARRRRPVRRWCEDTNLEQQQLTEHYGTVVATNDDGKEQSLC
jgi:hypothetical protein